MQAGRLKHRRRGPREMMEGDRGLPRGGNRDPSENKEDAEVKARDESLKMGSVQALADLHDPLMPVS